MASRHGYHRELGSGVWLCGRGIMLSGAVEKRVELNQTEHAGMPGCEVEKTLTLNPISIMVDHKCLVPVLLDFKCREDVSSVENCVRRRLAWRL